VALPALRAVIALTDVIRITSRITPSFGDEHLATSTTSCTIGLSTQADEIHPETRNHLIEA